MPPSPVRESSRKRRARVPTMGTPSQRVSRVRVRRLRPARRVVAAFAGVIVVGTGLLMLPLSSRTGEVTDFFDALFTATSAVCVTGLTVVDTATHWSVFGQVVILVLVQLGGLGIMISAATIGLVLARKLSVAGRLNAVTEANVVEFSDVRGLARNIVLISLLIEAITFAALFPRFLWGYGYGAAESAWYGVFHAVSAFNNAGFALFSDNLMGFAADPFVCLPLCAAIILGGLGFPVLMQLRKEFTRPLRWTMNTRLVLSGTIVLLIVGTLYITILEWTNPRTLGAYDPAARVLIGFFQSVQTRTAGFNSVDIGQLRDETWVGMDVLMFIGAGPAGTAGGIKITTFAVLLFILLAELRGEASVHIFGKRLSRAVHRQAISVVLLATAFVTASVIALMLLTGHPFDKVLFEAVSAFGTVGLTTGITYDLPPAAQMILVALMFVGRLGPLTIGTALALRDRRILYEFPEERPAIG